MAQFLGRAVTLLTRGLPTRATRSLRVEAIDARAASTAPQAACLIIGNEVLSGKITDSNTAALGTGC
jgi:hypothetical protein